MLKKYHLLLVFFLLSLLSVVAQKRKLEYSKKLTISEGLAHNGVTSMLEDSKGFIWFGTYDGVNRYDGYELEIYKNTVDKDILASNRVRSISEDDKGNIWFGTDEGISIYDYEQEAFKTIYTNKLAGKGFSGPIVRDILIDTEKGLILCATERNGILIFNKDYLFLEEHIPGQRKFSDDVHFFKGLQLNSNNYIFSTTIGLVLFDIEIKKFKPILKKEISNSNYLLLVNDHTILSTTTNGVDIINFKIKDNQYKFEFNKSLLEKYQFNGGMLDPKGKLWLSGLKQGVFYFDDVSKLINNDNYNLTIYNDSPGVLRGSAFLKSKDDKYAWFSTFNEGVYQFKINENPFKSYNKQVGQKYGLITNNVTHISILDDHRVFLTSSLGGITLFNTRTEKFDPLPFAVSDSLRLRVSAVFVDSRKSIWMRFNNLDGLWRLKEGSKTFEEFGFSDFKKGIGVNLRSFTEDKFGNIWVGGNSGAYRISINKLNEVTNIESLNQNPYFKSDKLALARCMYSDPQTNYIWVGADSKGLFRIDNKKDTPIEDLKIEQFTNNKKDKRSISSNFVTSIVRLPNDQFWVGTEGGGVCKVLNSDKTPEFIAYTEKDGLTNNVVKNILFDENYNLWISTNIGLNKFNTDDNTIRKFNDSDGLPFEDFWFASKRLDNGVMILSGLDGFCYFNPKAIPNNEKLPELHFENLKIYNEAVMPGDTVRGRVLLNKSLDQVSQIELKHNENVFSLDFTSLHFSNPKNHTIKYKLSPLNEEWIQLPSSQRTIQFSGLQPNEYQLSVMVSNSINEWSKPKKLSITIKPSIWNTSIAYLIYGLLGTLLIYLVIKVILKIQSLNHKVEIEQLEIDNVKAINESKLRFFSNISHEIKTPLTLISGPVNILLDRFKNNPEIAEKLGLVKRQSKKIQQLVDQVHDFRRADANALKMNYSRFSFNSFIEGLTQDFKYYAKNDDKNLDVIGEKSVVIVSADRDKLEKIFDNLLSNAFKYTRNNDNISLSYKSDDKDLIVSVTDTGIGIEEKDLPHVFERFYQSRKGDNTHISGSGIGLAFTKRLVEMHYGFIEAESVLDQGTIITVRLPIVKEILETEVVKEVTLPVENEILVDNSIFKETAITNIKTTGNFSEAIIFYAEDNSEMRHFVSGFLSKFFNVKSFRNGQECLNALESEWPDIVISDVQMPELNGLDLCIRIKSDLKTSHIPVILLTALSNIEDHVQGIRDGADAYIKKPFNVQRLVTNIEALLSNRKQLRERYQVGIPLTKENNKNNRNDNAFLDKMYSLMEENLDNQDFDLNSLAKELYLNRTHFYQKVKVLTNQTPFELLKMYRLKKAAELLVEKKLSVNEVFVMTGFKSRTHFTKIFKEKYQFSPSKYAAETRKKFNLD